MSASPPPEASSTSQRKMSKRNPGARHTLKCQRPTLDSQRPQLSYIIEPLNSIHTIDCSIDIHYMAACSTVCHCIGLLYAAEYTTL